MNQLDRYDLETNRLTKYNDGTALPTGVYDAVGNLANHRDLGAVAYDAENRMTQVTAGAVSTYRYDGEGRRVRRETGGVVQTYVYDAMGRLAAEVGGTAGSGISYLTADQLGSTRVVTNGSGVRTMCADYLPFGEQIATGSPGSSRAGVGCYGGAGTVAQRFTGKERDGETGLDYFLARYYSGAQGRFSSPDAPFADQHPADPQSWNLYAYGRDNPLRFVDPTGQAIELTGSTEEDRRKELEAIQASLVNSKVSTSLYVNPELGKDGKQTGRFFVGINGDAAAFAKAGGLEAGLAEVIGATSIVQFGFGTKVTQKQTFMEALTGPGTQDVGGKFGGAVTLRSDATLSGYVQTMVDPTDIRGRLSEAPTPTLGETVAHELLGHARAFVRDPMVGGSKTNRMAVDAENAARIRGGAARGQRTTHFGGFPK